jgi:transposase
MGKFLNNKQRSELLSELRPERQRRNADRIRVILLLDQGETYASIAKFFFLDEDTIANYRKRYVEGGVESLLSDDYKGSTSRLSLDQQMALEIHLLGQVYLSAAEILDYVHRHFKVSYKLSGLTALLKRMGFSYKKPKPVPGKADLKKQESFIDQYRKLQGKIYFGDSVHPHYNLVLGYGWIKRGLEMEVLTTPGRLRLNISGALCIDNQDIITRTFKTINAQSTCAMLKAIREKNPEEKKIFYILDNARYHHAKEVKALAEELGITLVYLPGYSPNLNPIERLWKFFKKKVLYNTCYPSFEEFKTAVREFFRGIRRHCRELETLLTDNFTAIGI